MSNVRYPMRHTYCKMTVYTWICGFLIIRNITKANNYFVHIVTSWIGLPTKNTKCLTNNNHQ